MDVKFAYRAIIQFLAGHQEEARKLVEQYNQITTTRRCRKHKRINIKQFWDKREAGKAGRIQGLRELERIKELEKEIA